MAIFATTPPNVFVDMVREFYSNISSYQSKTTSLTTFVRGIDITITPSSIAKILEVPDVWHFDFPYPPSSGPFTTELGDWFLLKP